MEIKISLTSEEFNTIFKEKEKNYLISTILDSQEEHKFMGEPGEPFIQNKVLEEVTHHVEIPTTEPGSGFEETSDDEDEVEEKVTLVDLLNKISEFSLSPKVNPKQGCSISVCIPSEDFVTYEDYLNRLGIRSKVIKCADNDWILFCKEHRWFITSKDIICQGINNEELIGDKMLTTTWLGQFTILGTEVICKLLPVSIKHYKPILQIVGYVQE